MDHIYHLWIDCDNDDVEIYSTHELHTLRVTGIELENNKPVRLLIEGSWTCGDGCCGYNENVSCPFDKASEWLQKECQLVVDRYLAREKELENE